MAQTTAIASWGNSEAIRIPKDILHKLGLRSGDKVNITANDKGNIEISPASQKHRHVKPAEGITYRSLFEGYVHNPEDSKSPWSSDDMVGAEYDAWAH